MTLSTQLAANPKQKSIGTVLLGSFSNIQRAHRISRVSAISCSPSVTCFVISSVIKYIFEKQLQSGQAKQQVSSTPGEALCSL